MGAYWIAGVPWMGVIGARVWAAVRTQRKPDGAGTTDVESARLTAESSTPMQIRLRRFRVKTSMCKGGQRTLLEPTDLVLDPGTICGILGASGSGKTTLMRVLARRVVADVDMTWNGQPLTVDWMRANGTYIGVDQTLPSFWTVQESLEYYHCLTSATSDVSEVMQSFHLVDCADRYVRNLSTGQVKLLLLGIAILRKSRFVCLDEPTSGLSDSDALHMMRRCAQFRKECPQSLLVMVLHQPRNDIFRMLDRVVVLREGRVVWNGPSEAMEAHFGRIGNPCPHPVLLATHMADHWSELSVGESATMTLCQSDVIQRPRPPPSQSTLRLWLNWWRWDRRLWLSFVWHAVMLFLTVCVLSMIFSADLYGVGLTRRAQLLYTSFPLHLYFIVAFKRSVSWQEASQIADDVYAHVGTAVQLWFVRGWAAWFYQSLSSVAIVTTMRWLDGWKSDLGLTAHHCTMIFLCVRCTMVFRDIVTQGAVRLRLLPEVSIYICCFVQLLAEGCNGLFVEADDMNSLLAPITYVNPLYYTNAAILYDELDVQPTIPSHIDVYLPVCAILFGLNGLSVLVVLLSSNHPST